MLSGLASVSAKQTIGIFNLLASAIAIASFFWSTTNIISGRPLISLIPPKVLDNLANCLFNWACSFLGNFSAWPELIKSSSSLNLLTLPLIVSKLVNMPPNHLLLI